MKDSKQENNSLLKILIIEDEPVSARFIEARVRQYFAKRKYLSFTKRVYSVQKHFQKKRSRFGFTRSPTLRRRLIIRCREFKNHNTQIIIISGRLEKAIDAFEFSVLDFVPKPIDENRLFLALEKFKEKTKWKKNGKYLLCKTDEEIKLLPFSEITYLKGEGKKTIIHSKKQLPITLKKT